MVSGERPPPLPGRSPFPRPPRRAWPFSGAFGNSWRRATWRRTTPGIAALFLAATLLCGAFIGVVDRVSFIMPQVLVARVPKGCVAALVSCCGRRLATTASHRGALEGRVHVHVRRHLPVLERRSSLGKEAMRQRLRPHTTASAPRRLPRTDVSATGARARDTRPALARVCVCTSDWRGAARRRWPTSRALGRVFASYESRLSSRSSASRSAHGNTSLHTTRLSSVSVCSSRGAGAVGSMQ